MVRSLTFYIDSFVDTEKLYDKVNARLIHPISPLYPSTELTPTYKAKIMGLPGIKVAELIVKDFQLPWSAEEYHRVAHEEVMKEFEGCELMPGVEKLVRHLHRHGVPMAVHRAQTILHFLGGHKFCSRCIRIKIQASRRFQTISQERHHHWRHGSRWETRPRYIHQSRPFHKCYINRDNS